MNTISFAQLFHTHADSHPDRIAFIIDEISYTYREVVQKINPLASWMLEHNIKRLGVLATRSLEAYLGILAAHWIGAAYVPLNLKAPVLQINTIIEKAQVDAIIIDSGGLNYLKTFGLSPIVPILAPELPKSNYPKTIVRKAELHSVAISLKPIQPSAHAIAYVLFTSGSTGEPKGIQISFDNLTHFLNIIKIRYPLRADDKVVQISAINFDLSVLELILAWSPGATMCTVPEAVLLAPAKFIQDHEISVWCSVPSFISIMNKLNLLKFNCFPSLRRSFFCGEALAFSEAELWQQTAPNQSIENLYGPTEATVACLAQHYNSSLCEKIEQDIVPIGLPFNEMRAAIINENHEFLSCGDRGELAISGAQVTSGYLDKHLNRGKFIEVIDRKYGKTRWYLTGDYCYQDQKGIYHYLGRMDNQCKILGYRVEPEEVEHYLRKLSSCTEVGVVVIKKNNNEPILVAAMVQKDINETEMKNLLRKCLPVYMIPSYIIALDDLPKNSNGKLDRKQLAEQLRTGIGIS